MVPSFLLTLREGLEAALIIGIVIGTLKKVGQEDLRGVVWGGAISAVVLSILAAVFIQVLGASFEGQAEEVFEGFTMLLAAGVLTWMIFWMNRYAHTLKAKLEGEVRQATLGGGKGGLFALAFLAVMREGIELALFLSAASFATDARQTLLGALLGFGAVILIAWVLFASLLQLNLQRFFQVTSFLLILFAAGLVAHGVHEFNEAHWIPAIIEHVWDLNPVLDEKSLVGEILKALFGYNGNPSLTEILAYGAYFVAIMAGLQRQNRKSTALKQLQPS